MPAIGQFVYQLPKFYSVYWDKERNLSMYDINTAGHQQENKKKNYENHMCKKQKQKE